METAIVNIDNQAFGLVKQEITRNNSLSLQSKGLYAYLASFADSETGECFPSLETILEENAISKNTFYKLIKELEKAGVIERRQRKYKSTVYKIINRVKLLRKKETAQKEGVPSFETRGIPNFEQHNNNTFNNTNNNKSLIESKATDTEIHQEAYISTRTSLIEENSELKKLIARYSLNKNGDFDIAIAKSIERCIFGAKKTATKELVNDGGLDTKLNLTEDGKYLMDFEEVELLDIMKRIFSRLILDRHKKTIKNPKRYMFNALKNEFKKFIERTAIVSKGSNLLPKLTEEQWGTVI